MPEKQTIEKAQKTKRTRKVPPTKAGEFVRGKIHKNSSWRARGQIAAAARTEEHEVARGPSRVGAAPQRTASPTPMLDDYRQNAFDCVQMARRLPGRQNKAILVLIAQAWIKLAEQNATLRSGKPGPCSTRPTG